MKRRLLVFCLGALLLSGTEICRAADLSDKIGTYTGSLLIGVGGELPDASEALQDQEITVSEGTDDAHLGLSLKNFSFMGLNLGDINLENIPVQVNGEEVEFEADYRIEGLVLPEVNSVDITVLADSYITSDNQIEVNLSIFTTYPSEIDVRVKFEGSKDEEDVEVKNPVLLDKAGIYTGDLLIGVGSELPSPDEALKDQQIEVGYASIESLNLSLKNFSFMGLNLGDINLENVPVRVNGEEVEFMSGYKIEGMVLPEVDAVDITVLQDSYITSDNQIEVNLSIYTVVPSPMTVLVKFEGVQGATGITEVVASAVYYDMQNQAIVAAAGSDYRIYSVSGQLVKTGVAATDKIDVNSLAKGLYIAKVAGVTTKFFKN